MKKIAAVFAALLLSGALFAQVSQKALLTGVNDFINNPSADWTIYDGMFTQVDVSEETYVFKGGFTVKILVGFSRYDFTCTVKNGDNDFSVSLTDVCSYACDKNAKSIKNAKVMSTSANVASQYAAQMKTEIANRIAAIPEDKIEERYFQTIIEPGVLENIFSSMSELGFTKFLESNVNGKQVSFEVVLEEIEPISSLEKVLHPNTEYKATGNIGYKKDGGLFLGMHVVENKNERVSIYSNNEKLVTAKKGSKYKVNGIITVKVISGAGMTFISYNVEEE